MDKNAIKTFAIESRRKMIESVKYQASLIGITADGIAEPISKAEGMETYDYGAGQHTIYDEDIKKRESLVKEIQNKGFDNVVEEVAYTWFNRVIAIRYMEVNDYLPERTRVLSSETEGKLEPDIVTAVFNLNFDFSEEDRENIFKLKNESKLDELFQFLFVKQCNKLNDILPGLFEKTDDYMELLLEIKFTDEYGIIRQLVDNISEFDFIQEVEIIGWLYQFYISEKKDLVNTSIKSKPVKREDIPAATQLFTPDWIVKYMVDNSLGRYWIERNEGTNLKNYLNYYFEEYPQEDNVRSICNNLRSNNIHIEELKLFDPCMGSGHILVYAFDVFKEIYEELGYLIEEIPELILKYNIYGLDIDERAYQLAYFALMMKGRQYDKKLFKKNVSPNILAIKNSNLSLNTINFINNFDSSLANIAIYLNNIFKNAIEYGSLIQLKELDFVFIEEKLQELLNSKKDNIIDYNVIKEIEENFISLVNQAKFLSLKYESVVTNPPYLNKYDQFLREFSKKYYLDYSKDLFSMFIFRNFKFCTEEGYLSFMTPMVWMYIKNFEKLRKYIINFKSIISLIELEYHSLWEIDAHVPVCTFVLSNQNFKSQYIASYMKLSDFTGGLEVQNNKVLEFLNTENSYTYYSKQSNYNFIPGSPLAYWASDKILQIFKDSDNLNQIADLRQGLASGNNKKFNRYWFEVNIQDINFYANSINDFLESEKSFAPHNKGGYFRKWYGNMEYIIKLGKESYIELLNSGNHLPSKELYFKESISWSRISNSNISFRNFPLGFSFDSAACCIFLDRNVNKYYILGLLNSNVSQYILSFIAPTLNYQVGDIGLIPIIFSSKYEEKVTNLVLENIYMAKDDWDSSELSWNFKKHPILREKLLSIKNSFNNVLIKREKYFNKMFNNEILLNKTFNDIYSLDIDYSINEKHISSSLVDLEKEIKSLISYAVGCMFGRYSLDEEGLQFAGGEFNINNYSKFIPDDDNIIPVLDTEYFNDDIVGRFVEFVKICFGEETLEENLDFIAGALKKKGKTSREIIRNYFLTDFFKDHAQTYKKTPIYWQFDSGKQNAFKCLIYMHRYEPGLVARVRTDYLHKTQKAIEQNLAQCENIIANSSNKSEISKAKKDKTKYIKQLDEIKVYDEALAHIANQRIEIDLDDGVKVNHAKFQNVEISKEGQKAKKINLLKKI